MKNFNRRTKILATLGPSSNTKEKIEQLVEAGVNAFRLNFSHGAHEDVQKLIDIIREIEAERDLHLALIGDLQGPKIRIGSFVQDSIAIETGKILRLDVNPEAGDENRVHLPHPEILKVLEIGSLVFLDDGKIRAKVVEKGEDYINIVIMTGTKLSSKKGINLPETVIPLQALTEKDRKDLVFALDAGVDWIAQSFVQRPEDVAETKKLMQGPDGKPRAALMAKIEKPSAVVQLERILELVDGIMLARGDLGIEMPPETLPATQKRIVRQVRDQGKPIVVATQMLESMIENARPTRAEASDVATAVYDGADCVMLSAETAAGKYPLEAVSIMDRICVHTEADETYIQLMEDSRPETLSEASDAITTAAYYVAQDIGAKAIVTYTMSGSTAIRAARQRPDVPIVCLTPKKDVARRLAISYGVLALHSPETVDDFTGPARHAGKKLSNLGVAKSNEPFVMTAGMPFGTPGSTNILRIAWVE